MFKPVKHMNIVHHLPVFRSPLLLFHNLGLTLQKPESFRFRFGSHPGDFRPLHLNGIGCIDLDIGCVSRPGEGDLLAVTVLP